MYRKGKERTVLMKEVEELEKKYITREKVNK